MAENNSFDDILKKIRDLKWISIKDKRPSGSYLACDKFGQIWVVNCTLSFIDRKGNPRVFDAIELPFDATLDDVLKGKYGKRFTDFDGNEYVALPREIFSWMPLPLPDNKTKDQKQLRKIMEAFDYDYLTRLAERNN